MAKLGPSSSDDTYEPIPVEVEPDRARFDASEPYERGRNEVLSFKVPVDLREARSAYCYDAEFHEAIRVYAKEHAMNPEQALRDNLGMLLWVEVDKLDGVEKSEETVTIPDLKEAYVDGRISMDEFEDRLERFME